MTYFNTTHAEHVTLAKYRYMAASQEDIILAFFRNDVRRGYGVSPTYLGRYVFNNAAPITSIRRALSNLTAAGKLHKCAAKVPGAYGRPEHVWRLLIVPEQGELLL